MFSASKSGQYPGYLISRSVRLRSSATAYFNRTPASAGSRTTWTWSCWVKRGALGSINRLLTCSVPNEDSIRFDADNTFRVYFNGATSGDIKTTQVFRDPSAWYHILVQVDTTQATASNRVRIYVNGVQVTAFATASYPAQNYNTSINNAGLTYISINTSEAFDGYLTEINFIDGQALTPSSFGVTNAYGVWSPIKYNGTYGTNGFYLNFSDNSNNTAATIGKDSSGNGNNWTPNNISVTAGATYDSMLDVPTPWPDGGNGRGNYCVLNPIVASSSSYVSGANLNTSGLPHTYEVRGTMPVPTTGKWYFEVSPTNDGSAATIGLSTNDVTAITPYYPGSISTTFGYQASTGNKVNNAATAAYGATYGTNDVVGVAVDTSAGKIWFSKNGVWQASGDPAAGTNEAFSWSGARDFLVPAIGRTMSAAANLTASINFGQRPFSYTPPSGFRALNTLNLPTPTILKGNQYFDATLWTGNGGTMSVTNAGSFQPDLLWIKSRSLNAWHSIVDSSRGRANVLASNSTQAEVASPANTDIVSLNADGFTVGPNQNWNVTNSGATFVGWQWKAGGTPAVTNTAGSITSTVSVGATQGFSVVTYTGTGANATVGHGLGVAPSMIIVKGRTGAATSWLVYHQFMNATPAAGYLVLNTTAAYAALSTVWNSTSPTSSVFSVGTNASTNANTINYVAYCFAEVAGFSRFGSFTGNGSTDGPFVFCGFRPRFVMVKRTDAVSATGWVIWDTARGSSSGGNVVGYQLYPNLSSAESSSSANIDILSNGFKVRDTYQDWNANGGTYIYAAFAENPFKYSLAR